MQCSTFLDQDLEGHLAVPVKGVGQGSVDGSTSKAVVQQREELRAAVLQQALLRMDNTTSDRHHSLGQQRQTVIFLATMSARS